VEIMVTATSEIDAIRSEFIEKVGLIAQGDGLPKTAGRMFGLFIFDNETVAFGDLAAQLQVSRASVSSSVRLLESWGILKRVSKPGERQDFFRLTATPRENMLRRTREGVRQARDDVLESARRLPPDRADTKARIDAYAGLYAILDESLGSALDRIKEDAPEGAVSKE
jgi:DNA-binding transcriptional regulator GbsR (MarR family)